MASASDEALSTIPLWIDGKALPFAESVTFPVVQSTSSSTIHHAVSASEKEALQAIESSAAAFKSWKRTPHTTRRELLLSVAASYERNAVALIEAQMRETSCEEAWARMNVELSARYLREIAAVISSVNGTIPQLEKPGAMGFVFKEPVGTVLCIAPWNAALVLASRAVASAIAAGCTVVFKASELCPRTHSLITQAFAEAGAPPGVLNQIQTRREDAAKVTESIIAHDAIRKIDFIGSAAVGRIISQMAAKHLKPILLELGGKCPALVLDDADLDEAAKQTAMGAIVNHGQICFSTERIIVLESVAEAFQTRLIAAMKAVSPHAGAAVTASIGKHANDVLHDAAAAGASFLLGGPSDSDVRLTPTIVANPAACRIVDEETFGPSTSLYIVPDDAAAIALANRSAYGLNATIWSRDMARALGIAKDLEYGQVHVNSISVFTAATASQGGVKDSGNGRLNGRWGVESFMVDKFVSWHGKV